MRSVIILSAIMRSVVIFKAIMWSVVAPKKTINHKIQLDFDEIGQSVQRCRVVLEP